MLIKSRVHPKVSDYHLLKGPHYFNQIPFPLTNIIQAIMKFQKNRQQKRRPMDALKNLASTFKHAT